MLPVQYYDDEILVKRGLESNLHAVVHRWLVQGDSCDRRLDCFDSSYWYNLLLF